MYTTTCCIEITPLQLVIYCVMTDSMGKDWLFRVHIATCVGTIYLGLEELIEDIAKWLLLSLIRHIQFTHT